VVHCRAAILPSFVLTGFSFPLTGTIVSRLELARQHSLLERSVELSSGLIPPRSSAAAQSKIHHGGTEGTEDTEDVGYRLSHRQYKHEAQASESLAALANNPLARASCLYFSRLSVPSVPPWLLFWLRLRRAKLSVLTQQDRYAKVIRAQNGWSQRFQFRLARQMPNSY